MKNYECPNCGKHFQDEGKKDVGYIAYCPDCEWSSYPVEKAAEQSVHPTVATVAPPEVESTTRPSASNANR